MITKETLIEAIVFTKNFYFKNVVNKNGKYIYSYLPDKNKKENQYNILRHAGTTYSILETYELMPDEELLKTAELAINFFIDKVKNFEINGNLVSAVIDRDIIKLGGNALGIIMLAKYTQITGNFGHLTLMQRMARWICETQDELGRFIIQKQQFSTKEVYNFTSDYYPGEAILSLVRLYEIDGNEDWLDCAELAAHYLIKIRDKSKDMDTILHDHWLLYGLNELYKSRPQELYFNHVMLITKSIMKSQVIDNKEYPYWNGAYSIPHIRLESTPTACRSEGLCAAYSLFHDEGNDIEANKIKTAIEEGIRFQLQTQLRPESVVNYKNKNLCIGAFQRGLKQYDLRIDFTQHNISSMIAYYKILSKLD
ncbi:hypothetical protein [Tissierella sp.]|uniref:hypothetical protein n=1 Tax=Tissierella sp. TaxID=41274 RepID=UPI002864F055|nr:hypothetical protein [Tissierella sp.]MDR7855942.1 hypothetical protein [Tissierella sp.]